MYCVQSNVCTVYIQMYTVYIVCTVYTVYIVCTVYSQMCVLCTFKCTQCTLCVLCTLCTLCVLCTFKCGVPIRMFDFTTDTAPHSIAIARCSQTTVSVVKPEQPKGVTRTPHL